MSSARSASIDSTWLSAFTTPQIAGDVSPARAVLEAGGYAVETISHPFG
jgi:hypothetical protein